MAALTTPNNDMREISATALALHLHEHAPRYFADFAQAEVHIKLVSEERRRQSTLYRFELSTEGARRSVLVKVPLSASITRDEHASGDSPLRKRPRLTSGQAHERNFRLEYEALSAIHNYFSSLNDPRFGTIRVLDCLPDHGAIVMEEVKDPSLRQFFMKASRLRFSPASIELDTMFRNAGAWLRAYDALKKEDAEIHHDKRADFIESIIAFTDFLASILSDEKSFKHIASKTVANALDELPESLPLGLRHGDFAMRNILIGPNNRVTVLDTMAAWLSPIYHDIAYFLTDIKTNQAQVLSQGLAFSPDDLVRYEQEFLVGYFRQEPIPLRAIQLYEIQAILNKWSSIVSSMDRGIGRYPVTRTVRLALTNRFFHKSLDQLL
jgi:aminoglycoside phosphotransferase (APT) family kinase protein